MVLGEGLEWGDAFGGTVVKGDETKFGNLCIGVVIGEVVEATGEVEPFFERLDNVGEIELVVVWIMVMVVVVA